MKKLKMQKFPKFFILMGCAALLLYGYLHHSIATGEAFKTFEGWCKQSQSLTVVVGQFQKAELPLFGNLSKKFKGGTELMYFPVRIVGSTKTISAEVAMKREHDTWKVDEVLISGEKLDLK